MREYFEKIYQDGFERFAFELESRMLRNEKTFVVTANPETLMIGVNNSEFDRVLKKKDTIIVPDGIGVVKAANLLNYPVKERVTGVEIVQKIFQFSNDQNKSIYLFGAQKNVVEALVSKIKAQYPKIKIAGYQDGYVKDKESVFKEIVKLKPDVVLVALGIPVQELLIDKYIDQFEKGIFVGVGGSFDVLSGMKKRAPKVFIKLNLEWLYRIVSEPKRIKRFYTSNVKFISKIRKMRKSNED